VFLNDKKISILEYHHKHKPNIPGPSTHCHSLNLHCYLKSESNHEGTLIIIGSKFPASKWPCN